LAGRPRKPSNIRHIEGNRSRTDIPPDMPLNGVPECPSVLTGESRRHFNFVAAELSAIGVTKRLDTEALSLLAWTWGQFWERAALAELDLENKDAAKLALDYQKQWFNACSRFGLTPADRAKIMATPAEKPDEDEERFFRVTG
jgi:P27 family predicted phage terminase small subunit